MKLSVTPTGPLRRDPKILIMFGQTKVGKTTMISKLPAGKYLAIDLEQGSDFLTINRVKANNLTELAAILVELRTGDYPFEYLVLDTIDKVVDWSEAAVLAGAGVTMLKDIPYGGGYSLVREKVMNIINAFNALGKKLIVVGHRKKTTTDNDAKDEFSISTLDLSGKLKNFMCADADAIGYIYRDEESKLMITFKPSDFIEAGARPEHLRGKTFPFAWESIYVDDYKTPDSKIPDGKMIKAAVQTPVERFEAAGAKATVGAPAV